MTKNRISNRLALVAAVLFPIGAAGEPLPPVPDDEPNDAIDTATATGLIDLGTAMVTDAEIGNGPLGNADRDFFSFDITPEAALPVLLTAAMDADDNAFDGYLRLFSESGGEILNHDEAVYPDLNPLLQTYIVEPGTYYVAVSHAMNPGFSPTDAATGRPALTGGYGLALILSELFTPDGALEPNDNTPTPIGAVSTVVTNQFIGDGPNGRFDVDRYAVDITAPAIVIAEVTPTQLMLLEPVLSPTGDSAADPRTDDKVKRLEWAVFEPGTWVISVSGHSGGSDDHFAATGFYDLSVEVIPVATGGGPYEPNDSLLQATPTWLAGPGSAVFSASVGDGEFGPFRGDVDFYELTIGPGERLDLQVTPTGAPAGLLPVVHLYDYLGGRMDEAMPGDDGSLHFDFRGDCAFPYDPDKGIEPKTFVIAITGARDRPTMDPFVPNPDADPWPPPYRERISLRAIDGGPGATGPYDADFTVQTDAWCDHEPDDSIFEPIDPVITDQGVYHCSAGRITDGSCPDPYDGVDLFKVIVTDPPVLLSVDLSTYDCGFLRWLRVFDSTGLELDSDAARTRTPLSAAGDYFIGVSDRENPDYDPGAACSGDGFDDIFDEARIDLYALDIEMVPIPPVDPSGPDPAPDPSMDRLFATSLDFLSDSIIEIDRLTGQTVASISPPETPLGGAEGLAFDGSSLFFMGHTAHFPFLYRLDPDTGEILDRVLTWFGSGVYGGMVAIAETLYIIDILDHALYSMPTTLDGQVTRIDTDRIAGISFFGALAATASPISLIASDAADPSIVHRLDAQSGALISSTTLGGPCPCNADFDGDGDVDDGDQAFFDECDWDFFGVTFGPCRVADLNCDDMIDSDDVGIFACQHNGPGEPPGTGCCPGDLPTLPLRATGLATTGPDFILATDWTVPGIRRFNRAGTPRGSIPLDAPAGALAGVAFPGADADGDFDVDLLDFAVFQQCFTPTPAPPLDEQCILFDFDFDDDVDLDDYAVFQDAFTGVIP